MKQIDPEAPQPVAPTTAGGPARLMSRQIAVYYTNCAMVATSPRDISLYFGRYVPASDEGGGQQLAELYERQIYMTVEQAEDLAKILNQTIQTIRNRPERQA
jgi:hypothetical protein